MLSELVEVEGMEVVSGLGVEDTLECNLRGADEAEKADEVLERLEQV
jgi:hypothetical protein